MRKTYNKFIYRHYVSNYKWESLTGQHLGTAWTSDGQLAGQAEGVLVGAGVPETAAMHTAANAAARRIDMVSLQTD